ncbi:HNH endonuclease [Mariprofundus ferrooxydans]|uniref:HNH endonuclease n=1 Tax=Mariprofundus ferrooxydans TaxID=314344 RepID=UPI001430BAE6|nr:HNH endonuclease signature motif containing protein [Mariprofundus ferrooxydans]
MMRLNEPKYSFEQTIDKCVDGITGNAGLKQKLTFSKSDLTPLEAQYLDAVATGELYTIPPINTDGDTDPVVINTLKKSELVKIYDQYFVTKGKPARKIYDALLNAAKEKCPFCGGIGTPRNLDHFLPKAHFPRFSILPHNLVPSCRDCNMDGKAQAFAINEEDQIIHPYADHNRFFLEQWIFSTYHTDNDGEPGEFEYYILPPEDWSEVGKQRVRKHFEDFDLAKRYATKAAELLGTVLQQIGSLQKLGLDNEDIKTTLLQPGIDASPFVNHWQKGMYQALMGSLDL